MLQNFLMKKMLKSQMPGVPDAEVDKIVALVEKNPELFKRIAKEAEEKIKGGKDRMAAVTDAFKAHEAELRDLSK
jgi:hypothetical protein